MLCGGGWQPPEHITEEEYNSVRQNKEKYPLYYVGYVGFQPEIKNENK